MTSEEFINQLDAENKEALDNLAKLSAAGEPSENLSIARLLQVALKNELEAAEIAAVWMPATEELDVKLSLARQSGDEAKHYRMIADRLKEMGVDAESIDPRASGYSSLFGFLRDLKTTVERVAAGQFTREGIALVRNECFIDYCRKSGDDKTAELYESIQRDERHHHELGRALLARYATTEPLQNLARNAARRTLEMAEEIQEMARLKAGISRAPGC